MQYTLTVHDDEPAQTVKRVLDDYDVLPGWDLIEDKDADLLFDEFVGDDYLNRLIVIRETLYEQSDAVTDEMNGSLVIERELFKAAEFTFSAIDVYVAGRIVELLDLDNIDLTHNITPGISSPGEED